MGYRERRGTRLLKSNRRLSNSTVGQWEARFSLPRQTFGLYLYVEKGASREWQ